MRIMAVTYEGHRVTQPSPITFMSTSGALGPENSSKGELFLYSQHSDTKMSGVFSHLKQF